MAATVAHANRIAAAIDDAANRATGAVLRRQTADASSPASARPEQETSVIGGTGTDVSALRSDSTRSDR